MNKESGRKPLYGQLYTLNASSFQRLPPKKLENGLDRDFRLKKELLLTYERYL